MYRRWEARHNAGRQCQGSEVGREDGRTRAMLQLRGGWGKGGEVMEMYKPVAAGR